MMALMYVMELNGKPCDWQQYAQENQSYLNTLPWANRQAMKISWKKIQSVTTSGDRKKAFMLEANRKIEEHYSWKNIPKRFWKSIKRMFHVTDK